MIGTSHSHSDILPQTVVATLEYSSCNCAVAQSATRTLSLTLSLTPLCSGPEGGNCDLRCEDMLWRWQELLLRACVRQCGGTHEARAKAPPDPERAQGGTCGCRRPQA